MNDDRDASLPAPADAPPPDPWTELRRHTPARIALGRAGTSLPTHELLHFAAAHAAARDAVHVPLDVPTLQAALAADGWSTLTVASRAASRDTYLRRPDLGRRLSEASVEHLRAHAQAGPQPHPPELVIVVGDGLSATGVQRHAVPLLRALRTALEAGPSPFSIAPVVIATQSRVALADEVGQLLGARLALILLGERPGLSSPDSVGAYLTHGPAVGTADSQRNCVSNIRPDGLPFDVAARRIAWLAHEALRRRLTGVALKDDSDTELLT
jgi:ethanolamine ammonia-lyase small subunit